MDISPYLGTIISVIITAGATYAAFASRLTRIETLLEKLDKAVDHDTNQVTSIVERTYKLESDTKTMWNRIDELKLDLKQLRM